MKTELYWIEGSWSGKLAIMPRPRGGNWLEDEVQAWRQAGLDAVVSLLTLEENADLDLAHEAELSQAKGIQFIGFPIPDRSVPLSRRATLELLKELRQLLVKGKNVGIHCRQGIGRSAVVAACLLIFLGIEPEAAFQRISVARGYAIPETSEQREWVIAFARELQDTSRISHSGNT
jgi:protein-tyrosine phosphatase